MIAVIISNAFRNIIKIVELSSGSKIGMRIFVKFSNGFPLWIIHLIVAGIEASTGSYWIVYSICRNWAKPTVAYSCSWIGGSVI